ncbi:hypothetical protein [Hoeflea sp. TYP-13]
MGKIDTESGADFIYIEDMLMDLLQVTVPAGIAEFKGVGVRQIYRQ